MTIERLSLEILRLLENAPPSGMDTEQLFKNLNRELPGREVVTRAEVDRACTALRTDGAITRTPDTDRGYVNIITPAGMARVERNRPQ